MPKKRRNSKKGGMHSANPAAYSSAATYALATAGDTNTQYNNVFDISRSNQPGNALVGLQGQTVGGRRKSRRQSRGRSQSRSQSRSRSRSQKGGLWGVINKALVPFGLLAMQQTYRRKKGGSKTCRRR